MGYHHFHLGMNVTTSGHVDRTDELIFAEVQRDTFKVIAIFGHEVFEPSSSERSRLWSAHDQVAFRGAAPGSVMIGGMITTSGHSLDVVRYAQACGKMIWDFDPKLNDLSYMASLYPPATAMSPRPKFSWGFNHLDLLVVEEVAPVHLILVKGWS